MDVYKIEVTPRCANYTTSPGSRREQKTFSASVFVSLQKLHRRAEVQQCCPVQHQTSICSVHREHGSVTLEIILSLLF